MKSNKIKNMLVVASVVISTTLVGSTSAFAATLPSNSSATANSSSEQSIAKTTTNTKTVKVNKKSSKESLSKDLKSVKKATVNNSKEEYIKVANLGDGYTSLNLRQGPGANYNIIGELSVGTKVKVISKSNKTWYKVNYNGKVGYINATYTEPVSDSILYNSSQTGTIVNLSGDIQLNFRSGPSTNYK